MDERLEQLCRRLADDSGPLTTPGPLHDLAARIAGQVRAGHPDIDAQLDDLADLVEAAVDVHGRALAESLGLPSPGVLTRETGSAITETLRKDN